MRKILLFCHIILFICFIDAAAQQQPLYSQYMMNGFLINPAMAGGDGYTSFNLTARQQWLGFVNAPSTQSFSAQSRLLKRGYIIKTRQNKGNRFIPGRDGRVGIGGFIYNDKNGLVNRTGLQFSYAYHIEIRHAQLSFGLSGSVFQFKINKDELFFHDEGDPLMNSELSNPLYVPDASAGVYLQNRKFFAGISASQLFQSPLKIGSVDFRNFRMYRHYYLTGGYRFSLANDAELEPSVLLQVTEQLIAQSDIGCKVYFKENYWAGMSVRTSGAFILLAGIQLKNLYIGYAFDYNFSAIRKHSFGSHELSLAIKLGDDARRFRWLNRY